MVGCLKEPIKDNYFPKKSQQLLNSSRKVNQNIFDKMSLTFTNCPSMREYQESQKKIENIKVSRKI